jgi:hypothetical protein
MEDKEVAFLCSEVQLWVDSLVQAARLLLA